MIVVALVLLLVVFPIVVILLRNVLTEATSIHSSLERDQVLTAIQEVIINLLGSEELAIFELIDGGGRLSLASAVGIDPGRTLHAAVIETLSSGNTYVRPELTGSSSDGPALCIPLKVGERVTGVIAIYSFLSHKERLEPLDHELCALLATHAGSALYSSNLYARAKADEPAR